MLSEHELAMVLDVARSQGDKPRVVPQISDASDTDRYDAWPSAGASSSPTLLDSPHVHVATRRISPSTRGEDALLHSSSNAECRGAAGRSSNSTASSIPHAVSYVDRLACGAGPLLHPRPCLRPWTAAALPSHHFCACFCTARTNPDTSTSSVCRVIAPVSAGALSQTRFSEIIVYTMQMHSANVE